MNARATIEVTPEQFALFASEAKKWLKVFGLDDVDVSIDISEDTPDSQASMAYYTSASMASVRIERWQYSPLTEQEIRRLALHECLELLIIPLSMEAQRKTRKLSKTFLTRETHRIIHRLMKAFDEIGNNNGSTTGTSGGSTKKKNR